MEVLKEVRRLPKERTYLKKEHYLRKNLDFKIYKTKPITKEPSLVFKYFQTSNRQNNLDQSGSAKYIQPR